MSDTKDKKQILKEELNSVLGAYIPNKIDLENLTTYLYKVITKTFQDSDMHEELKKSGNLTEMDKQGFLRAVHTIALSASSNVMYQTLKETFKSVKNQVDMVQSIPNIQAQSNIQYAPRPQVNSVYSPQRMIDNSTGDFNIDLSMGKSSSESREALMKAVQEERVKDQQQLIQQYQSQHIPVSFNIPDEQAFDFSEESMASMNMIMGNTESDPRDGSLDTSEPPKFSGLDL